MTGLWTLCVRQNLTAICQTQSHFTPANLKTDSVTLGQVLSLDAQKILGSEYLVCVNKHTSKKLKIHNVHMVSVLC